MPNGVKTRFAGLLRDLLRRFDENETGADISQTPRPVASSAPPAIPVPKNIVPQPRPVMPPAAVKPPSESITEIELPLSVVLQSLPPQLHARLALSSNELSRASISIPVSKIMPQLALGTVKITFGELRRASPELFNTDEEYDSLPVILPLNEILARVNPGILGRNPAQKTVAVPEDITGPFANGGEGVSISAAPLKPQGGATPIRMATPPPRPAAKATPPPVAPPPPAFVPRSVTPAATPEQPAPTVPFNGNGSSNGNGVPARPAIPMPPVPIAAPTPPPAPPKPALVMPKPAPVAPAPAPLPETVVSVPLAAVSENWPEPLRLEIGQLISANAQAALPLNSVEAALKRGRVIFTWRNLRSWIRPQSPPVSVHDNLELELPLNVIAPLFLSRLAAGKAKTTVQPQAHMVAPPPTEIPNLFFGFPQPQPQPPPETLAPPTKAPVLNDTRFAARPADVRRPDTNFYSWAESDTTSLAPRPGETEFKRPSPEAATPATDFSSRNAAPKDVVSRAAALPGVAGALVALPDGLMVASQIPAELNADTFAAFLPQIYGRVSQSTKELRMGDLNNLQFTVGNVPWRIFRVHGVYFAAFGRPGEPLPTAQLALLAAELDRKKQ